MDQSLRTRATPAAAALALGVAGALAGARTAKPVLHGQHWVAITGKLLVATAAATIFRQGGSSNHGDGYGIAW